MQLQKQDYMSLNNQLQQYQTSTPSRSRPETALSNLTNHQQSQNQVQSLTPNNNKSYSTMNNLANNNNLNSSSRHNNSRICYPMEENSSEINLRVSPSFRDQQNRTPQQNNHLEQENQLLKNQIEMLRLALVGLCKNQQLDIPELLPLIQSQTPHLMQMGKFNQNIQNPEDKPSIHQFMSQSKENQSPSHMIHSNSITPNKIFQNDENNPVNQTRNEILNLTSQSSCSPNKSRRKRSQRQKSPVKNQLQSIVKAKIASPCFRDDMPLQIQCRKGADDTLVLDKSSIEIYQNQANQTKDLFNQNEDSIMMISQVKQNIQLNDENEDIDSSPRDSSQIQIKYARMLEELENESQNPSQPGSPIKNDNEYNTVDFGEQQVKTEQSPQVIEQTYEFSEQQKLKIEDTLIPKGEVMETMRSNKYEYEQFYEHEINNLKNELQMFAMEEQKILQLITKKADPIDQSPSKLEEVKEIDQTFEEDQQIQQTPARIRLPLQENIQELSQEQKNEILMNNLREAFLELKDVLSGEQEEESFIKPIKIASPTHQYEDNVEINNSQCHIFQVTDITQQNISQDQMNLNLENELNSPLKSPLDVQNLLSDNKSARAFANQKRSPYIDRSQRLQQFSKECSSNKHNFKPQQTNSNNFSSSIYNDGSKTTTERTSRLRQDQRNSQEKSPMVDIYRVNNRNLKSKSRTPVRIMNKINGEESKNSPMKKYKYSDNSAAFTQRDGETFGSEYTSNPIQMETIEMLAKRKSLAEGLKQQEEPMSDEDERKNSIRKHYQRFTKLRYQNEYEHTTESDEILLDLKNSDQDYASVNIMSRDSSCVVREKQDLERLIEDRKATINNAENYFGLYSFEKSQQLKNERCESIKKAEELLNQLIADKPQSSRPSYLASTRIRGDKDTSKSPLRYEQEPIPVQQPTELSFNADINNSKRHSKRPSMTIQMEKQNILPQQTATTFKQQKLSIDSNEVINLQINNGIMNTYEQCMTEQYRLDEEENKMLSFNYTGNQQKAVYSDLQPSDLQTPFKYEQQTSSYMMSPMDNGSNYQDGNISESSSNYKEYPETPQQLGSNIKRRSMMQLKKPFQKIQQIDQSNYNSRGEVQTTTNQSTQNKSQSCDNTKRKLINNSKNFENKVQVQNKFNHNSSISDQLNTIDRQTTVAQPAILQYQKQYNLSTIDTEAFYMDRSKSVLKRRDDLIKRKQLEIQSRIETKNMKYDQMMNTRNLGQISQNSRAQSSGKSQVIFDQQNQTPSQMKSHYHSKQRSGIDSRSLTPIKQNNHNESQRQSTIVAQNSYSTIEEQQPKPEMIRKSSVGKSGIKFDKRPTNYQPGIVSGSYPINANLNLQTPSGKSSVKNSTTINSGIPSTTQSKSSKITSECSSYRKRISDVSSSNGENCSIVVKESKNVTQSKKQQPTSLLKNNIVSKTLRMGQNKPKEYVQLKHEKSKQQTQLDAVSQSVANTQISEKHSLNHTMNSQQSLFSNNNRSITSSNYQPQIISQTKLSSTGVSSLITGNNANRNGEHKKSFPQSRSINRLNSNNNQISNKSSNYNTNQKAINLLRTVEYVEEDVFMEQEQSIDNRKNHKGECRNCQRLINKGLSTDFCLDHYGTPRCVDE